MSMVEPGLAFWLDFVESEGGVWEPQEGIGALALLPEAIQRSLELPEAVHVSADPESAREEGGLLLIPGHPALDAAAASVLDRGDIGRSWLEWPRSTPPALDDLVRAAADQVPFEHGRIDPGAGMPSEMYLPVLRLGTIVHYTLSLEDHFQEREEIWVDARTGLPLPSGLLGRVGGGAPLQRPDRPRPTLPADLAAAVLAADAQIEARAASRQRELSHLTAPVQARERARTAAYYEGALESIARRQASAPAERHPLLDAQKEATALERERRLAEIEEQFRPRHETRPFRLHLVGVPALAVPVHVRRGSRVYPLVLTWVLGANRFIALPCPHCRALEGLVAGRERLGCQTCLPRPTLSAVVTSNGTRGPAGVRPPQPARDTDSAEGGPGSPDRSSPVPDDGAAAAASSGGGDAGPPAGESGRHPARPRAALPQRPSRDHVRGRSKPDSPGAGGGLPGTVAPARKQVSSPSCNRREGQSPTAGGGRVEKQGNKLAVTFWETVGVGRWRRKFTHPHSPMAVLQQLWGAVGPLTAVGLPPGLLPESIVASTVSTPPGIPHTTSGTLAVGRDRYTFTLRWSFEAGVAVVGELLPHPMTDGLRLPPWSWVHPTAVERLHHPPAPRVDLNPVAAALWKTALPRHGLPLTLRCLALWEWAEGLADFGPAHPEAVAAALAKITARRSAQPLTSKEAACVFATDPAAVEKGTRLLMTLLRNSPRPW